MKLNRLENRLFENLLRAELDVPFRATVSVGRDDVDLVLEPSIDSHGYFGFDYFNAINDMKDLTGKQGLRLLVGIHPELDRAWKTQEDVTIQYRVHSPPFHQQTTVKLPAKVEYVTSGNRGRLHLEKNIVRRGNTGLNSADFCIVDFPDFRTPGKQMKSVEKVIGSRKEELSEIADDLGDDASINVKPAPHHVVLYSDDGWKITITRDDEETRGLVSHTGQIERYNNDDFSENELLDILELLKYFLAFAAGTYCHFTTVVGYGPNKRLIWGMIGKFEGERRRFTNWFGASHSMMDGIVLERLFPSFSHKWQEKRDELIAAIECYVHSNSMRLAGIPADAMTKSYAGLEIVAGLLSGRTPRNDGGDVVDAQLCKVGIPDHLLCESDNPITYGLCKTLIQKERCDECNHGAHLLNDVRNYIAHPLDPKIKNAATIKQKFRARLDSESQTYFVLHDLSQFYLEYLLLALCETLVWERRRLMESREREGF
ncbi:MAG: hypothetical protein OXD31_02610 [Chloroflexi bacterium]|nr:hypothetical protein [Chloroflexota bacterium]